PKAWKGLIDCLERSGVEKIAALPECLYRAAEIAEGKGNYSRARGLRLRLGTVLDHLGRKEEALEAVLRHLDSPEAMAAAAGDGSSGPAAATERLSLLLLAAVLETDEEQAAVVRRVEKRLAKDSSSGGGISSTASGTSAAGSSSIRAAGLAFEYRAKALAKDDDSAEGGGRVGRRLCDAMEALLEAGQSPEGDIGGDLKALMAQEGGSDVGGGGGAVTVTVTPDKANTVLKTLVARFCRAYLGRAVHRAEAAAAAAAAASSTSAWREVLAACARVERAVGGSGWDDGWIATATLIASTYALPNHLTGAAGNGDDGDETTAALLELRRIARGGAQDEAGGDNADGAAAAASPRQPWLKSEACLHLAGLALWAGDVSQADALLKTAAGCAATARIPPHRGSSKTQAGAPWAGALSGPGSDWRELSLRCLVDERLGDGGGDPAAAASLGLGRVDAAIAAFDESFRLRGPPDGDGDYADVLGRLGLARASLLLKLGGRLEEARSAVEMASAGVVHVAPQGAAAGAGDGIRRPPSLHCRALCVASDVDLASGEREQAKGKLREALEADAGFGDALGKLGWLLLGFGGAAGGGGKRAPCEREDVEAARPLLERAVAEEPGCSSHAIRLARCYWEVGGLYREDRKYCFNSLLKAAKLDPSNAEAFEWLGYWYQGVGGDQERARGCFLRSVKLDPSLRGAGEALALLYLHTGQDTLAVALFRQCAAVSVACHWAWAGLGRTKILEGKLAEAASHIQQAIRGCPTSWSYWSDLGWCYHTEGKQAAALKAYTRAEDLLADHQDPPSSVEAAARVRVRTQVGTIQRQIGQVDEAVSSFNDALTLDPESILALEGSGEAYLAQAHARTSEGLYNAAAKALRNGRDATKRFLNLKATDRGSSGEGAGAGAPSGGGSAAAAAAVSMECAWKLLGDLHTYAHKLPPMCFEDEGSREKKGGSAEGGSVLGLGTSKAAVEQAALAKEGARNRVDFVAQGADAYRNLVQLLEARENDGGVDGQSGETSATAGQQALVATKAAALYDLGLNYLLRGRLVCSDAGEGSGLLAQEVYEDLPEVAELTRSAEEAFRRSVEADPAYSEAWNGLGATMSKKPLAQQHCWVRSVQLEHNPSAWANLGMLYVRWGMDIQA
ncbi:unnamed protein product, partial [Ectocarpus fasciculatus]